MPRVIELTVSPTGETKLQTKGFTGSTCAEGSKWLEAALGIATDDKKTAEYYSAATEPARVPAGWDKV